MFVNDKLEIFVHEVENQKCIEHISNVLTEWHMKRSKNPKKFWHKGDICVAQRFIDGSFHRAKIRRVHSKRRKCLVNNYCELFHENEI